MRLHQRLVKQNAHLLARPLPTGAVTTRAGLAAAPVERGNGTLSQSRVHVSPFAFASAIIAFSLACTPTTISPCCMLKSSMMKSSTQTFSPILDTVVTSNLVLSMTYLQISLVAASSRVIKAPLNKVMKRWWKFTRRHSSCRLWLLHLSNLKDRHRMWRRLIVHVDEK